MPSSYTANPTATEAPAAQPNGGVLPIVALPVDGDPPNGASFAQPFKVLADFTGWLMKPLALLGSWASPIRNYVNARGQRRLGVDHLGFPGGQILTWQEDWIAANPTLSGTSGAHFGRWFGNIVTGGSDGAIIVLAAQPSTNPLMPMVEITIPKTVINNNASLGTGPTADYTADTSIAIEWSSSITSGAATSYVMGLADTNNSPGPSAIANGVFFRYTTATSTWRCITVQNSVLTDTDSLATASVNQILRFRIELLGANASDDGTARAIFYINGLVVANVTATLPLIGSALYLLLGGYTTATGSPFAVLRMGPVRWGQNLWAGDVF